MIEKIKIWVDEILAEEPEYFCVQLFIKPIQNVKVYLDGDQGIKIEKCTQINRKLRKLIEDNDIFNGTDYSLEVSSPGVDNPLLCLRQYKKNILRPVQVILNDETKFEGTLKVVNDSEIQIEIEEGKGNKKKIIEQIIPMENIKSTIVLIKF